MASVAFSFSLKKKKNEKKEKKIKYKIRHQLFLFLLARLLSRGMQHSYSSEILILADIRVYHRQIWAFQKQVSFLLQNQNGKIKRKRRWDNMPT